MNNTKMKDLILKGKWFQTKDLHTLIIRVQDFFNIDLGNLQEQLFELEEIAYKKIYPRNQHQMEMVQIIVVLIVVDACLHLITNSRTVCIVDRL